MKKVLTFSEMDCLAEKISEKVRSGDLIALIGDLGTGKTTFVKKIAEHIGITDQVRSPTFTIVQEYYTGRMDLYHFDVYRIGTPEEIFEIGFDDYLKKEGIKIIEWADLIYEALPDEFMEIKLFHFDEDKRDVEIKFIGNNKREEEILEHVGFRD